VWVDKPSFDRICTEREQQAVVLQAPRPVPATAGATPRPERYWPCPDCGGLMNRQNFARVSGVVLDVCRGHGVWFNHGELTRIVEFIRGGGLARGRERELLEIREERERLLQQQRATSLRDARLPQSREGMDLGFLAEAASFFDDLF
jgi:Zn-finger nucleic acid-binding protein